MGSIERMESMGKWGFKKRLLFFSALTLLVIGATAFLSIWSSLRQTSAGEGDKIFLTESTGSILLEGWHEATEETARQIHLCIERENAIPALFVVGEPYPSVSCKEHPLVRDPLFPAIWLSKEELPIGESSRSEEEDWTIQVEGSSSQVFLGDAEKLLRKCYIWEAAPWCCFAGIVALFLYTLAMFSFKTSESYLLDFLFFQGMVLARYVLRGTFQVLAVGSYKSKLGAEPNILISIFALAIALQLSGWKLFPTLRRHLLSYIGMIAMTVVLLALSFLFPSWKWGFHFVNFTFFSVAAFVLCLSVAKKQPGSIWALFGLALLLGIYVAIFANFFKPFSKRGILFFIFPRIQYVDLPFILGIMVCVNRRYTLQFIAKEELSLRLEEMVEERTAEVQALQEERHSMITNIFHDLRTPLFVMGNSLDILEGNPETLSWLLPVLKQRCRFARDLTEDLFLLIKLQDKKVLLAEERVNLSEILESLCSSLPEIAAHPSLQVIVDVQKDIYVWGDALRLQQAFQNLIINAVHFTPEGGTIQVKAHTLPGKSFSDRDGELEGIPIEVSVYDSGPGIKEEDAAHVFERYFHTDKDHKHGSSGLGLSIAKEIVNLHHGEISYTSGESSGTTFWVKLLALSPS